MGYYSQKPRFWPFLAKKAIFGHFSEKRPGSYRGKTREFGQKWPKSWKSSKNPGFPGSGNPGEGGFTSTPRAGAPRFRRGLAGTPPGEGLVPGLPGSPEKASRGPQVPGTPGGYRGAPPRGVDVKPPLATAFGTPETGSQASPGAGEPLGLSRRPFRDPGDRGPDPSRGPGASWRPRRALPGPREPPPGVVLHQPLAAGPRGSRPSGTEVSAWQGGLTGQGGPRPLGGMVY